MQACHSIKELPFFPPRDILTSWPSEMELLYFGGSGRFGILAICFTELDYQVFARAKKLTSRLSKEPRTQIPFTCGYMGIVSYDQYAGSFQYGDQLQPSRVFRVSASLVFDQMKRKLFFCQAPDAKDAKLDASAFLARFISRAHNLLRTRQAEFKLKPYRCYGDYLSQCKAAIREIENGRYYQINLLRYFALEPFPSSQDLIQRFLSYSGPYGAILFTKNLHLISFSPERFVSATPSASGFIALTQPIKGTRPRSSDHQQDLAARESLTRSQKDHRELHMIVDLMRNDLGKVSVPHSVELVEANALKTFKDVYHLEATIRSQLRPNISFEQLFRTIAPAGSITGAPKIEVMKAIRDFERRSRGYFMGNSFFLDDSGYLDSSVMIRTLVSKPANTREYEYAAGSGIVLDSVPITELQEITAKCKVLADSVEDHPGL